MRETGVYGEIDMLRQVERTKEYRQEHGSWEECLGLGRWMD